MLAVRKDDNSVVSRIVRGVDREILGHETAGNSFVHVHSDRLGSVSAETDHDGNITHSRVYDPFGNTRSETGSSELPLGYTGQEMDPVTGLVQMKARWYDPDAGIFISEDPRSYSPADPFSVQEYLYANADPVNNIDPSGMAPEAAVQPVPTFDVVEQMKKNGGSSEGYYVGPDGQWYRNPDSGSSTEAGSSTAGPVNPEPETPKTVEVNSRAAPAKAAATARRHEKARAFTTTLTGTQGSQKPNPAPPKPNAPPPPDAQPRRTFTSAPVPSMTEQLFNSQAGGEFWRDTARDCGIASVANPLFGVCSGIASALACKADPTAENCAGAAVDVFGGYVVGKAGRWAGSVLKDATSGVKYFEEMKAAIPAIVGKVERYASKSRLGRALEDAGYLRMEGAAAHHIVPSGHADAEEAREILKGLGIGIDQAENGMFLPGKLTSPQPGAYHPTLHTDKYIEEVTDRLRSARDRDEAIRLLDEMRIQLQKNIFPR